MVILKMNFCNCPFYPIKCPLLCPFSGACHCRRLLSNDTQVLSLTAIMNELAAESESPANASSGRKRSDSGRLAILLAALKSGRPDVSLLRDEFVDFLPAAQQGSFREQSGGQ